MVVKQFRSAGPMTLNNYTPDEVTHLRQVTEAQGSKVKYVTFCFEKGKEGTNHLQIYAQASTKLSLKGWHEQLGKRISNIVPTINQERAIKYCQGFAWNEETNAYEKKPGSENFEEFGKKPQPGERTDLISFKHRIDEGEQVMDIAQDDDMFGSFVRYGNSLSQYGQHIQAKRQREMAKESIEAFMGSRPTKQHWEVHLQSILFDGEGKLLKADPRTIYWYFDTKGKNFKSANAKFLLFTRSTYLITGGSSADIYYAYNYEDIIIYNQCASQNLKSSSEMYKVLEEFKDGYFLSTKYQTRPVSFPPKHLIVFANSEPDLSKLMIDRIVVVDILQYETSEAYRSQISSKCEG